MGGRKAPASGGSLEKIIADLKQNQTAEVRERAAKQLSAALTASSSSSGSSSSAEESHPAVAAVRAGAIAPLVALMSSGTDAAQVHAGSCLSSIAAAGYSGAVVQAGGLAPVVAILRSSSQLAQASACSVLASVSADVAQHAPIAKAGVLQPLVRVMRSGLVEARIQAALTIANFCGSGGGGAPRTPPSSSDDAAAATEVMRAGAIPTLVHMLPGGKAQMAAASALAALCSSSSEAQDATMAEGGIAPLLSLLNTVNVGTSVKAAMAVAHLAHENTRAQAAIAKAGGIGPLLGLLTTRHAELQASAACALARIARQHEENQAAIAKLGGLPTLVGLLSPQHEPHVQSMAAMALAEVCREVPANLSLVADLGGIASLVGLLRMRGGDEHNNGNNSNSGNSAATHDGGSDGSSSGVITGAATNSLMSTDGSGIDGSVEAIKAEVAGAVWVLAADSASQVSIASAGALKPLVHLVAGGNARAQMHASNALTSLGHTNAENQTAITSLLVGLLSNKGSALEAKSRALAILWRLIEENPSEAHETIASAGSAAELIALVKHGSAEGQAFGVWALSLCITDETRATLLEENGEACLVQMLQSASPTFRSQAAASLARLATGDAAAQAAIATAGAISPLIQLVDPHANEPMATREAAATALSELAQITASRDSIIQMRGIAPLVTLLCNDDARGQRSAAKALGQLANGGDGAPFKIAEAGAISPLVKMLAGGQGDAAQQEAAGALFHLADDSKNRIGIAEAGGIGPLVLLLGSTNSHAREHAEGALVRLSIEDSNRELIIKKLVSMLFDKGNGGEEQAAAALANLASDSADNRNSIVQAGGIPPLLALLESGCSHRAKENAVAAISQLAHNHHIQRAIAKAGGVPLLANTVISSSANAKDTIASTQLHSLCAFAIAQLARRNRETQHALADAGAIPPLVTMLGSPSADMQANVARALASLSRDNAENQAAIARTGAIAPLCALVREGAPLVKEQSAAALWALAHENAPNKATVAKLGGIEPLVGLLVNGESEASLEQSVGALTSLAAKHADNCEAIAKMVVARLTSRAAMAGVGAERILRAVSILCDEKPSNQLAVAKAGGVPPLVSWLSGAIDARSTSSSADAQREAAHALLAVVASNAPIQALLLKSEGLPALIGLASSTCLKTQEYAARSLWHLASSSDNVEAIAELNGVAPIVAMLALESPRAQELAAVVVSRLTRFDANKVAAHGGIAPLVTLLRVGTSAAVQHAAAALADIAHLPAHRDAIAFEANGILSLVRLLDSVVVGTPETAGRVLAHLARDDVECGDDGGAPLAADEAAEGGDSSSSSKPGEARRQRIASAGGIDRLIGMLWAVPNKSMGRRMWDLVAKVIGEKQEVATRLDGATGGKEDQSASGVPGGAERRPSNDEESDGSDDSAEGKAFQKAEQAAATLSDLAYGDLEMQDMIISAGGVPPLVRLLRSGSRVAQENAARAIWHLCAAIENQGVLVECGAVSELVGLSKSGSAAAQELAAAVISDLAKGAIIEREAAAAAQRGGEAAKDEVTAQKEESEVDERAHLPPPIIVPYAVGAAEAVEVSDDVEFLALARPEEADDAEQDGAVSGDRLSVIAAAGGITPLVGLVTNGSQVGKTRAASALWHLSANPANQVQIAKAGGIIPLVQLLDDGNEQGTRFAADALAHLAVKNPANQLQIAKKLVGLVEASHPEAQQRAAHALWQLAERNAGAPVRVVNAGAISPLVSLLGSGCLAAKKEAAGALTCLALHDFASQLAIATGLVVLLGVGSALAQVHVTRMLIKLAQHPTNRGAIVEAGAIENLVKQLQSGTGAAVAEDEEERRLFVEAQHLAATVLLHVCGDSTANVALIVEHGGIAPLVDLLHSESAQAQIEAAAVLCAMARHSPTAQSAAAQSGAVEPLVRLLDVTFSIGARSQAAGTLHGLADGSEEIKNAIAEAGAIPRLVHLLYEDDDAAQRQAARALGSLAVGGAKLQDAIAAGGGAAPLVELLYFHGEGGGSVGYAVQSAAARAISELVRDHPTNQLAAAAGIEPLVALIRSDAVAQEAKEEAASALWSFSSRNLTNQTAAAAAGCIEPLVQLLGAGSERAQSEAAGALASLALDHEANRTDISQMLVHLLEDPRSDDITCTKAARAVSRLARAHPSNQCAIAAVGGIAPLVRMLQAPPPPSAPSTARSSVPSDGGRSTPPLCASSQSGTPTHADGSSLLLRELACALWSMVDGNAENQSAIAEAGGVPRLIHLLGKKTRPVHQDASGVLWSLAELESNRRAIAEAGGIQPLVTLVSEGDAGAQRTAAGALHNLAARAENRELIAACKGISVLVALLQHGSGGAKEQAAGALAGLVVGNADNQAAVASELVAALEVTVPEKSTIGLKPSVVAAAAAAGAAAIGRKEHVTRLIHQLSLDPENRGALSKAGAIPQLALQLRDGTEPAKAAAAGALAQLSLKSPQYRVHVTAQLIKLLGSDEEAVRQRAGAALKDISSGEDRRPESQMTVAMAGGIDRFVALLKDGSLEAQEYALWLLAQSTDHASRVSIAKARCALPIIGGLVGGKLSPLAQEYAACVLAGLASSVSGVEDAVRASNHRDILAHGGIEPLVRLLRHGSDGAKKHAATALTQLSCELGEVDDEAAEEQDAGANDELEVAAATMMATTSGPSRQWQRMQSAMATAGAITAFIEWLQDPSLGRPELAAQALAHIASGSAVAQTTIAEEGAIAPLVAMLVGGRPSNPQSHHAECQRWASSALAALAEGHPPNQIAIAEEGGVPLLIELIKRKKPTLPHESATRALWHLASDRDNQLSIAKEGGLPPLVALLEEGSEQASEWAAAALEALSFECADNQVSLYKASAVAPLISLLGCGIEEAAAHAQGALLNIAAPTAENRSAVMRQLIGLLEQRNASAQMKAAESIAILASRSLANRSTLASLGAITPLVRLLGDGRMPSRLQVDAAAALRHLGRGGENKAAIVSAGGAVPLVRMLGTASNAEAQDVASGTLHHLATMASAQALITEHGGIAMLVALLSSARLSTANTAAGTLWHLASNVGNRAAIVKAGGVPRLVHLLGVSDAAEARESLAALLGELARNNHHKAILAANAVPPLVALLQSREETPTAHKHAACALWALTSPDAAMSAHAAAAALGAIAPLVSLLREHDNEGAPGYAAAALCNLAASPLAKRAIVEAGGVEALMEIKSQSGESKESWLRSQAIAILDQIGAASTVTNVSSSIAALAHGDATAASKKLNDRVHLALAATESAPKNSGSSGDLFDKAAVVGRRAGSNGGLHKRPPMMPTAAATVDLPAGGRAPSLPPSNAPSRGSSRNPSPRPSSKTGSRPSTSRNPSRDPSPRPAASQKAPSGVSSKASSRASSPRETGAVSRGPSRPSSRPTSRAPSPRPAPIAKTGKTGKPADVAAAAAPTVIKVLGGGTDGQSTKRGAKKGSASNPMRRHSKEVC